MPMLHRRVFYGKVGTAGQLVGHLREGEQALRRYGVDFKTRLLTDHMSGRPDRVVAEWEAEKVGDFDALMEGHWLTLRPRRRWARGWKGCTA